MVNRAILVGHLGRNPELRQVGGQPFCVLSVATSRRWTDRASGERRQETEWHRVEVWGGLAEQCGQNLAVGRLVYLEGRLETEWWTDKTSGLQRQRVKVVAHAVRFLGQRTGPSPGSTQFGMSEGARLTELRQPQEPVGAPNPVPPPDGDSFEALPTI